MNFKQLVLEALDQWGVIRDATKMDLKPYQYFIGKRNILGAWVLNHNFLAIEFASSDNYMIYKHERYEGFSPKDGQIGDQIREWELKKHLSPDTLNTFGGLIDEL
jgi:hypothetical protein